MTMQRRDFLKAMGSSAALALAQPLITPATAEETKPGFDTDPIGGYVKRPPKAYLFTDHRLIRPSDLCLGRS